MHFEYRQNIRHRGVVVIVSDFGAEGGEFKIPEEHHWKVVRKGIRNLKCCVAPEKNVV